MIDDVSVIVMDVDTALPHRTVIIRDGRIDDIVDAATAPRIRNAIVIDGRGKYLAPGLVDAHAHVHVRSDLERYVVHGVTSVREMWGLPRSLRWRDAIARGAIAGPTMVVASTYFWVGGPALTKHVEPTDTATARALVRQAADDGYDLIKVVRITDLRVLDAIVDEARTRGLRVSGHYPDRSVAVTQMLASGMSSFEHADEFATIAFSTDTSAEHIRQVARELRERHIGITTILTPARKYLDIDRQGERFYTPAQRLAILDRLGPYYFREAGQTIDNVVAARGEYVRQWTEGTALAARAAGVFLDEGVDLAIGTEGIGPFFPVDGVGVFDEMELLRSAGLSNAQVLRVATLNGAKLLGFDGRKGEVRRGYDADLIMLGANPLLALEALHTPEAVFVSGRYYATSDLEQLARIF